MSVSVEELSASLVREFLSRKGLKMTLAKLDEELPRTSESISNRAALAKAVRIERLMRKNKELPAPYRTMIEVIVSFLTERSSSAQEPTTHSSEKKDRSIDLGTERHRTEPLEQFQGESPLHPSRQGITGVPERGILVSHNDFKADKSTVTGLTRESKAGIPLTKSLDTALFSSTGKTGLSTPSSTGKTGLSTPSSTGKTGLSTPSSTGKTGLSTPSSTGKTGLSTPGEALNSAGNKMTHIVVTETRRATTNDIIGETHATRKSSSSRRKDRSVPQAVQLGARPTRHQKFNPRSFTEMEVELEKPIDKTPTQSNHGLSSQDSVEVPLGTRACFTREESSSSGGTTRKEPAKIPSTASVKSSGKLLFEDLEDLDLGFETTPPSSGTNPLPVGVIPQLFPAGQPISLQTSMALRELLFGSAKGPSFNAEWKKQNFFFCDLPGLEYGLVQHKGGPCGVLACLQAYILKHLLFSDLKRSPTTSPQPTPEERLTALVAAMSEILWKAGGRRQATVTLQSAAAGAMMSSYNPGQITDRLVLHHFKDYETLQRFIRLQLPTFQNSASYGCILFLLSVVLSKGIESIREDMDERDGRLIGAHGYCCQELVNLLLTGFAVSNVFDGTLDLNTGGSKVHLLKGIPEQSEIGFLSLFEHYGSCTVGSHYKEPEYPIWVVCSESHFTVLFSPQRTLLRNWLLERNFDLFHYDGLANQDEIIRLSVDTTSDAELVTSDDLIPPMELCIRTKWRTAAVNWNGTEPIL